MQLCRDCRYLYHSERRVPCLCCESTRLTISCSENLVGIVNKLLDLGIEVASASCDIHDYIDDKVFNGKTVQIQLELGYYYDTYLFTDLPPGWLVYEYHTVDDHKIGSKYTGISHSEDFTSLDDEELEFATALTISNLELWLDNFDSEGFKAMLKLGGYDAGQ